MKIRKLVRGVGVNDSNYAVVEWETIGYVNGKQKRKQVGYAKRSTCLPGYLRGK